MPTQIDSILQAAKFTYLRRLGRFGIDRDELRNISRRLDHFIHWSEACDVYRAGQLGHQLIYDYQSHFDYQLYWSRLTHRRLDIHLELNRHWRCYTGQLNTLRQWLAWLQAEGITDDDLSQCVERSLSRTRLGWSALSDH